MTVSVSKCLGVFINVIVLVLLSVHIKRLNSPLYAGFCNWVVSNTQTSETLRSTEDTQIIGVARGRWRALEAYKHIANIKTKQKS